LSSVKYAELVTYALPLHRTSLIGLENVAYCLQFGENAAADPLDEVSQAIDSG
jgi:hypothetical protein